MRDALNMKSIIATLLLTGLSLPALAVDKTDLDNAIRKLTAKFEAMQAKPEKRIPADNLRKAQGIVLLDRTKAGFLFAYQGGGGLAMVRDPKSGQWSPPAFFKANEASLGLQIGGEQSFVVVLLMNTNSARTLTEPTFSFGGEASGTAGDASGGAQSTVTSQEQVKLVYADREGLYGGVSVKGGSISPDTDANIAYYGQALSTGEILFDKKGKPDDTAIQLAKKITEFSSK